MATIGYETYATSEIGNYYGDLLIRKTPDGKFLWGVENYNGTKWDEINEELFNALLEYGKMEKYWCRGGD